MNNYADLGSSIYISIYIIRKLNAEVVLFLNIFKDIFRENCIVTFFFKIQCFHHQPHNIVQFNDRP